MEVRTASVRSPGTAWSFPSSLAAMDVAPGPEASAARNEARAADRAATLNTLVQSFERFGEEVHVDETAQRTESEARIARLEGRLGALQAAIAAEVDDRIVAVHAVESVLDAQVRALDGNQAARLAEAKDVWTVDVTVDDAREEQAGVVFAEDCVATERAIKRAHVALLKSVEDMRERLGLEIAAREVGEAAAARRATEELASAAAQIQGEAGDFQATLGHLRDDEEAAHVLLGRSNERFKQSALEQLTAAQKLLKAEAQVRLATEAQLVATLEGYAGGLTEGLRNVNKLVREDGALR